MNRYTLRKDPEPWISLPNNGGEVGDMADITCELNKLLGNYEVAMDERDELREAVRAYRDAKGRYHTQLACERLVALLPENDGALATGPASHETNNQLPPVASRPLLEGVEPPENSP